MKRILLALLFVVALLLGVMTPATADAAGEDDNYDYKDETPKDDGKKDDGKKDDGKKDDGKEDPGKKTEVFPADEKISYTCPTGFDGPDANNQCSRSMDETIPATPVYVMVCPPGYTGPDASDDCTRSVEESIPATPVYVMVCPPGYTGPDASDDCTRSVEESIPATPVLIMICPPGYTGPDAAGECTKVTTTTERIPADALTTYTCLSGFTLDDTVAPPQCVGEVTTVMEVPGIVVVTPTCPAGYVGPNASGDCVQATTISTPAIPQTEVVCPLGTAPTSGAAECAFDIDIEEVTGVVLTETEYCPDSFTLAASTCSKDYHAPTRYICPADFLLDGVPTIDINNAFPNIVIPPTCSDTSNTVDSLPQLYCQDGLADLSFDTEPPTCRDSFPAPTTTAAACPSTYTGPDGDNRCTRPGTRTITIAAVRIDTLECPTNTLGPDANGNCFQMSNDTVAPEDVETIECPAGSFGPQPDGICRKIVTETITVDAVPQLRFSCPAGYTGPTAQRECTKEVTTTDTVDAYEVIDSYTCPAGYVGPDANNVCTRTVTETADPYEVIDSYTCPADFVGPDANNVCTKTTVDTVDSVEVIDSYTCPADYVGPDANNVCTITVTEVVDADKVVSYHCPADSVGPDDKNMCTRTIQIKCPITFYDYPNGHQALFSESGEGSWNLDGALAKYNDDIESVSVPKGCSVSVSDHYDGGGWCYSLGSGVHNLPDDEMSWFSIPATGCNTVPVKPIVCKIEFFKHADATNPLFSESSTGTWNLWGKRSEYNNRADSVRVPDGCHVSVAQSFNAQGWCYTLDAGVHNLPANKLSWFSTEGDCGK